MTLADCQRDALPSVQKALQLINGIMDRWSSDGHPLTSATWTMTRSDAVMLLKAQKQALEAISALCGAEAEPYLPIRLRDWCSGGESG